MWTCTARASHNVSTRTTAKARETSARTVRLRREVLVELVQRDTPRVVRARRLREEERRGGVGGELGVVVLLAEEGVAEGWKR